MPSPHLVIRPLCSTSPDAYIRGVRPKMAPTVWDFSNLEAMSTPVRNASAVMVPTPHQERQISSACGGEQLCVQIGHHVRPLLICLEQRLGHPEEFRIIEIFAHATCEQRRFSGAEAASARRCRRRPDQPGSKGSDPRPRGHSDPAGG
jgi:hypothetical protein